MLTIGFYSLGTDYEREAGLLRHSLDRVGMAHDITGFEDRGGWYANTSYKAEFIRDQRQKHRGPLLYIDVDAFVHGNCNRYFEGLAARGVDFGAHWFHGPAKGHDKRKVRDEGWWMLSGTLFLGDTDGCRRLLDTWYDMNSLFRDRGIMEGGGQKNLWFLVTCMEDLKVERLPGRYCYVFDKPWAYDPKEPKIIEHTIASRDHRGAVERVTEPRKQRIHELATRVRHVTPAESELSHGGNQESSS